MSESLIRISPPINVPTANALAALQTGRISVKDPTYGAQGDWNGTTGTDDSAAILAAQAAMTSGSVLYFPKGRYRFAQHSPTNGAAIFLSGLSNIGVYFEPGAELVLDNLSSGSGTSHGVCVYGSCSNVTLENVRVVFNGTTTRSVGDGFRFLGYPSDSAPPGGWTTTTGPVTNVQLINCTAVGSPQTGCIFMGCSDIRVSNFRANSTKADGLHFNACRRVNVNGHTAYNANDDGLAFVTYYDPSIIWQSSTGPFNQPSLGQWSNYDSHAGNIVVSGGAADGLRVAGSYIVGIDGITVENKSNTGIIVDSAIVDGSHAWAYQASVGISIDDATIENCSIGLWVPTPNVNSTNDSSFWTFGLRVTGITIRDCSNWTIRTSGDGSANSVVAGLQISDVKAKAGSGGGGGGAIGLSALRDSQISNVRMEGSFKVYGQDAALSGAVSTLPRHNLTFENIHVSGGSGVLFQDVNGLDIGRIRCYNSGADGVQFVRVVNASTDTLRVVLANRNNTGTVRATFFQKVVNFDVGEIHVDHDANNSTTWRSLEVGGGDSTDIAANGLRVEKLVYMNTINQAFLNIALQSGSFAAVNYYIRAAVYNGGAGSPVWQFAEFCNGLAPLTVADWNLSTQTLSSNGAVTFDSNSGSQQIVNLQANATSSSIASSQGSAPIGRELTITWIQDATGSRTITWPTNCVFANASAPANTAANARTTVTFLFDGTNWNEVSRLPIFGTAAGTVVQGNDGRVVVNVTTTDPTVSSDTTQGYAAGSRWVNTNSNVFYTCINNSTGAAVWVREVADVQTFGANGTWTKPAWAKLVTAMIIGCGAPGGSGPLQASGTACSGGSGGGGGAFAMRALAASLCSSTESVTVPSAPNGAAAQTTNSTAGIAGSNASDTTFGSHLRAGGGVGGPGGALNASSASAVGGTGNSSGGAGSAGANGAVGNTGGTGASGGGGSGGGISSGGTAFAGGAGNNANTYTSISNGSAGTTGGGTGGNGGSVPTNEPSGGASGGGGGANASGNGGTGGNGGSYGAGGGGGGAALNGSSSGAGGNGAHGIVVVISQ